MYSDDIVFEVPIIIEPDEDGFHAYCPDLPGLHICGDTKEEAFENAKDAVKGFLLVKIKYGEQIPPALIRRQPKPVACRTTSQREHRETVGLALAFA